MSDRKGKRTAVIGWPIAHSRSPLIHGTWLERHGIDGSYDRLAVPPERAEAFFGDFAAVSGLIGANVTIPHKEAAFASLDHADEVARILKAANTLWVEEGRLCGTNTDVYGFLANLDDRQPGWDSDPGPAAIIGAGGASRAVIHGLLSRGFGPVRIYNRTLTRAEALSAQFGQAVEARPFDRLADELSDCALLVNTSSLGMKGQPPLTLDLDRLNPEAVVTDIVYTPLETALLATARSRGNRTADGLGMLLHQAVPGFERWYGVRPVVDAALRNKILADLKAAS